MSPTTSSRTSTGVVRRTQSERRATTRGRLLDAAAQSLLEHGYAATTIARVQDAAGLARGTLLHHFPTRADLMVAATVHLVEQRMRAFGEEAARIDPEADRLQAVIDLAWRDLSSPEFFTALELWVAARTDPELREVLLIEEARLFAALHTGTAAVLGEAYADDPRVPALVEFTLDVLTGLSMMCMLNGGLGRSGATLRRWRRVLGILLGELDPSTLLHDPRA
ncbi:MAG: TetR/AcrR family transcriptional regulator [Marmoricola sp.]